MNLQRVSTMMIPLTFWRGLALLKNCRVVTVKHAVLTLVILSRQDVWRLGFLVKRVIAQPMNLSTQQTQ
jgi:hypothetical protein